MVYLSLEPGRGSQLLQSPVLRQLGHGLHWAAVVEPLVEDLVTKLFVVSFNLALDILRLLKGVAHSYAFDVTIQSLLQLSVFLLLGAIHELLLVLTSIFLELKVLLDLFILLRFDLSLKLPVVFLLPLTLQ